MFLGMENELSFCAFRELLDQSADICGVIVAVGAQITGVSANSWKNGGFAKPVSELPLISRYMTNSISQTAAELGLPIVLLSGGDIPGLAEAIAELKPDIACVSCFPIRIPRWVFESLKLGFLNLHPSLLPYHKGPVPLFWIFRSGRLEERGITVHLVAQGLDSGDIVLQQRVLFEPGVSGPGADRVCGEAGGSLLARAVRGLHEGSLEPFPQPSGGSYEGWPDDPDFRLSTAWSAYRAFDFMRATSHWHRSYPIEVDGMTFELTEALEVIPDSSTLRPSPEFGEIVLVEFSSGWLVAKRR